MRFSLPYAGKRFVVSSYILLSLVSFFPLVLGVHMADPGRTLALTLGMWLLVWILFAKPDTFHWLLLPAYLAFPAQLYLQIFYHQELTTHHVGLLLETSPAEAREFLGTNIWLVGAIFVASMVWFTMTWRATRRTTELEWNGSLRKFLLTLMLVIAVVVGFVVFTHALRHKNGTDQEHVKVVKQTLVNAGQQIEQLGNDVAARYPWTDLSALVSMPDIRRTWPFGIWVTLKRTFDERRYLSTLESRAANFTFGATSAPNTAASQTIVLVIGESSRYDRWSLNGYGRDTNPMLSKEPNLVMLSDMVTPVSATRLSVPVIMTRKPAMESLMAGFSEKSFIAAYREAGYKTWWISNQQSIGQFDTPVTVYAKEADVTEFLNAGDARDHASYDSVLLPALKDALADPHGKKLIVLHSLGSHWNYSKRYPAKFDHWQPSLDRKSDTSFYDLKQKEAINNSYDNAILYIDSILDQVIGQLKTTTGPAAMMYLSDHGEVLYDGTCKLIFHGHNTQYDFHIPAFMWYSDAFNTAYPQKVQELQQHQHFRLNTENMFDSVVDAGGIRYPGMRMDRSFLSAQLIPHERRVDSYGWTDYDNSTFRGDCREAIDRNKPLPRLSLSAEQKTIEASRPRP